MKFLQKIKINNEAKHTKVLEEVSNTSELHKSFASDKTGNSVSYLATSILAEQKEKERRQLNIIGNNTVESDDEDSSARKAGDITEATEEYLRVELAVTNTVIIGKSNQARIV